ncbi:MAG TPA: RNA methyltransferase [Ktedonobacteraceae bacterium]|nr:RNA methyltransferase [Ktedonobacteraceae bacterium]
MAYISSPSNPRIGRLRDLHTTRGRKNHGLFLMEGPHLLEALLDAAVPLHEVYYQPSALQRTARGRLLLDRLLHATDLSQQQLIEVSERVLAAVSDVQTSQGVVSVLSCDTFSAEQVRKRRAPAIRPALLILDGLADPGNMGAILRTALAANAAGVLLTPDCVDHFSPKVVRAAAGAHIALPIEADMTWPVIAERVAAHSPGRVLLAEAGSPHLYYEQDLKQPFALIIGNEAHGPSQQARSLATLTISIPLSDGVESLNAAMATGIILYEAVRQRQAAT